MTITATQYLFLATTLTATGTATSVGAYTVPASTRAQLIAVTLANSATSNGTNYADVSLYNGSFSVAVGGKKTPIYPGSSFVVVGLEKHVLPTSGAVQVAAYATTGLDVAVTLVELT